MLIRPGAIGDCILSLPALESLRADYTEVWVPTPVVPLIRLADRVRSIMSTGLDSLELSASLIAELRGFDSIVSWYAANRPEFIAQVRSLGLPFEFRPALPPERAGIPHLDCPGKRSDFAVIHPFSGSTSKNWPLHRYRELAAGLGRPVRWCAGPEEQLEGATRIDNLWELACWLATARIYIGNDSGITHLAAAVGTPVVALFGPTDPATWAPRGERVAVVRCGMTMESISVEAVVTAVARVI